MRDKGATALDTDRVQRMYKYEASVGLRYGRGTGKLANDWSLQIGALLRGPMWYDTEEVLLIPQGEPRSTFIHRKGAFTTWNLRGDWRIAPNVKVFAGINNLFNLNRSPIFIALDQTPCIADRALPERRLRHLDARPRAAGRHAGHVLTMKRIALAFGVCVAALAHAAPIEVRDALGRTVVLPAPPQRLVTIFASNTELVTSLGLVDRIVGVEDYTRFPPEAAAKPKVGGRLGFSVDAVVAQRPDLVIVTPARQAAAPARRSDGAPRRAGDGAAEPLGRRGARQHPPARPRHRRVRSAAMRWQRRCRRGSTASAQQVAGRRAPRIVMVTGRVGNGMLLVARPDTYTGERDGAGRRPFRHRRAAPRRRCRPRRSSRRTPTCCCSPARRRRWTI